MWSREVANLLNPKSEHDWRLMAQRLGYSNEDVRAWATQPDPCLAVLNEWFARNSTSKASKGIISVLEEINRTDAADIVKKALQSVGQCTILFKLNYSVRNSVPVQFN